METVKTGLAGMFIYQGIQPGAEKISIGLGRGDCHYTAIVHGSSNVLDIHCTYDHRQSPERHQSLFRMEVTTLLQKFERVSGEIEQIIAELLLSQRLTLGKITRRGSFLQTMEINPDLIDKMAKMKKSGRHIRFLECVSAEVVDKLITWPEDISTIEPGGYLLYNRKSGGFRFGGLLLRLAQDPRDRSFFFVNRKKWNQFMRKCGSIFEKEFAPKPHQV